MADYELAGCTGTLTGQPLSPWNAADPRSRIWEVEITLPNGQRLDQARTPVLAKIVSILSWDTHGEAAAFQAAFESRQNGWSAPRHLEICLGKSSIGNNTAFIVRRYGPTVADLMDQINQGADPIDNRTALARAVLWSGTQAVTELNRIEKGIHRDIHISNICQIEPAGTRTLGMDDLVLIDMGRAYGDAMRQSGFSEGTNVGVPALHVPYLLQISHTPTLTSEIGSVAIAAHVVASGGASPYYEISSGDHLQIPDLKLESRPNRAQLRASYGFKADHSAMAGLVSPDFRDHLGQLIDAFALESGLPALGDLLALIGILTGQDAMRLKKDLGQPSDSLRTPPRHGDV
ncbi:MAG: hypothetical protein LBC97_01900 [Bifidobacteriaceae bacterium]|nr:hypothetical protein [Bifidobacteriaceae bacterium]